MNKRAGGWPCRSGLARAQWLAVDTWGSRWPLTRETGPEGGDGAAMEEPVGARAAAQLWAVRRPTWPLGRQPGRCPRTTCRLPGFGQKTLLVTDAEEMLKPHAPAAARALHRTLTSPKSYWWFRQVQASLCRPGRNGQEARACEGCRAEQL